MIAFDHRRHAAQTARILEGLRRRARFDMDRTAGIVRREARTAAAEMAVATFPPGTAEPGPRAKAAIAADIRKVFVTASETYGILRRSAGERQAKAFFSAYARGDLRSARRVLRAAGGITGRLDFGAVSSALHERARSGPSRRVALRRPLRIVDGRERQAYIRKIQTELGKSASGWAAAAADLGGEQGIPGWKSTGRHGSGNGRGTMEIGEKTVRARLRNQVRYVRRNIGAGTVAAVAGRARGRILRRVISAE